MTKPATSSYVTDMVERNWGFVIERSIHVQVGAGPTTEANLFKVTGTILIVDQWAELTEVTALTDMTSVYADVWDGTKSTPFTDPAPGADFSGLSVGSFFTRAFDSSQSIVVADATENNIIEPSGKNVGEPFTVTQKNGVDTFLRFIFTPGADVDFRMLLFVVWTPMNGGVLELLV
jgi:hypothetical protein